MQVPELFEKHHSTLKKTSLDDSTSPVIYMSESEQEVVDFDAVKEEYKKKFCCNTGDARSCDALLIDLRMEKSRTVRKRRKSDQRSEKVF